MHDLIIENATLVDGFGTPRRHGAVAVKDGRIVQVGAVEETARQRLDADGRVLAPGIADLHTHFDA